MNQTKEQSADLQEIRRALNVIMHRLDDLEQMLFRSTNGISDLLDTMITDEWVGSVELSERLGLSRGSVGDAALSAAAIGYAKKGIFTQWNENTGKGCWKREEGSARLKPRYLFHLENCRAALNRRAKEETEGKNSNGKNSRDSANARRSSGRQRHRGDT